MSEDNKALIRRFVEGFWNQGNSDVIDEVFAANFVYHTPPAGVAPNREGLKQANIMGRAPFSDIHTRIDDLIAEGDKVVWRWSFRGTHTRPLLGIPATGKQLRLTGIVIDRIEAGKIVERWDQSDVLGMLQQLGVISAPAQGS